LFPIGKILEKTLIESPRNLDIQIGFCLKQN